MTELLHKRLFTLGAAPVTLSTILVAVAIVAGAYVSSTLAQRAILRGFAKRKIDPAGGVAITLRLVHYGLLSIAVTVALQTSGVDLSALIATGAVFAVGIGLALQDVARNFISGAILILDRTIRLKDVVEVQGRVVVVEKMGLRSTIVRTRDDERLIVPNTLLVQGIVKNLTLTDSTFRLRVTVGVAYASDLDCVRRVLGRVGNEAAFRNRDRDPVVMLTSFGASSIEYELSVWSDEPWKAPLHQSDLREAIEREFRREGIVIAFPQIDVHLSDIPGRKAAA